MQEAYLLMLEQETVAWRALEDAARRQRQGILAGQAQTVEKTRTRLRDCLRLALLAHQQTLRARPHWGDPALGEREQEVDRAQTRAQQALQVNIELMRDTCRVMEHGLTRQPRVVAVTMPAA
jgi:hypothetical protein